MPLRTKVCLHLQDLQPEPAANYVCEQCLALGDGWVHLRVCQTGGLVGCCDNSKNQHATRHFHETSHPVIISAELRERWAWCYPDQQFAEY